MMLRVFLLALLLLIVPGTIELQEVPTKLKGYGFSIGDPYALTQIQFFFDFLCPDSKTAYNLWQKIQEKLNLTSHNIKLTFQVSPLPFHFYSTKIHQIFFHLLEKRGPAAAEQYIGYFLNNQNDYAEEFYLGFTGSEFDHKLAVTVSKLFDMEISSIVKGLEMHGKAFETYQAHWKYSVSKGVTNTPTFYVNGVLIDGADQFGFEQWVDFLEI